MYSNRLRKEGLRSNMNIGLEDKFHRQDGRVLLTGMEAIVCLILEKQRCDQTAGAVNQTYLTWL